MKTLSIQPEAKEVNALLDQARDEDLLVRAADGTEFVLTVADDFDEEIVRTRQNAKLMNLLDERGKQEATIPLSEMKRQLGMGG